MKSRISFFNKTIFWKNIGLYWPIWAVYSLIVFIALPGNLWLSYYDEYNRTYLSATAMIQRLVWAVEPMGYTVIIAITAVIVGMALYHYLYNSRSANMIHSLPVDRAQLFGTNLLSGLAMLIIPLAVNFILAMMVCLSAGNNRIEYLAVWLLICVATAVIAFSFVTFCAFITGHSVAMPVYVIIMNFLIWGFYLIIYFMVNSFSFGVDTSSLLSTEVLMWFSPILNYLGMVQLEYTADKINHDSFYVEGVECILVYLALAAVLYVAAYFFYKKRHIETAGEFITVNWLKPIFRVGVGIMGGFIASISLREIFAEAGIYFSTITFIILLCVIGCCFYFIADMLIHKTFRVFCKANWKRWGAFVLILFACYGGLAAYTRFEEMRVPDVDDIDVAYLNMGIGTMYQGEAAELVVDIHEEILEDIDYYVECEKDAGYHYYDNTKYINIAYILKDGTRFSRTYTIPENGAGLKIIEKLDELEQNPKRVLSSLICNAYERVDTFEGGYVDLLVELEADGSETYTSIGIPQAYLDDMYHAIIKDMEEGTLLKYNNHRYDKVDEYAPICAVGMTVRLPEGSVSSDRFWQYYHSGDELPVYTDDRILYQDFYINFGKDCTNILKVIEESGMVEKDMKLFWNTTKY